MSDLTLTKPGETYGNLLQAPTGNGGVGTSLIQMQDGLGNGLPVYWATNMAQFLDTKWQLANSANRTKLFMFDISGFTVDTTNTWIVPDASSTFVGTTISQTLTNKTINGASNSLTVRLGSDVTGTVQAANFPALTGDLTTPGASLATTIAAGAVTLAKLASLAANSVIGNNTGAGATPIAVPFGSAGGVATLDGSGKLTAAQIPAVLVGAVVYQGTWNANTNTPTLADGVGTKGFYYKVSTAGTTNIDGISDWQINDTIIFNGTTWDKIDSTDQVTSVAGKQGVVTLVFGDIGGTATAAQLPTPTTSSLGGIQAVNAVANQWISSISTAGVPALTQPAFTDISGSVAASQMPALTGDITTSAGAVATSIGNKKVTYAKIQDVTDQRLLGRSAGTNGAPMEITIGSGLDLTAGVLSNTGGAASVYPLQLAYARI